MDFSSAVGVLVGLLLAIVLLLVLWYVLIRRRTAEMEEDTEPLEEISDARIDADEQPASLVSEQIEEMVKQRLAAYPELANVKLDFATGEDESLVIWVGDQSYTDVDHIPDERIRSAIAEAVETFNR